MTERRVLLAAVISALFLSWYAQFMSRWTGQQPRTDNNAQPSPAITTTRQQHDMSHLMVQENLIPIESDQIRLEIGENTGVVRAVTMKRFTGTSGTAPLRFSGHAPLFAVLRHDLTPGELRVTRRSSNSMTMESARQNDEASRIITYTVDGPNLLCNILIRHGTATGTSSAKTLATWVRGDELKNSNNILEILMLSSSGDGQFKYKRFAGEHSALRNVPRGTMLLTLSERHFCQSVRIEPSPSETTILPAQGYIAAAVSLPAQGDTEEAAQITIYFGPRDYFALKRAGFERAFPIGIMGQIGLSLLVCLNWIAGWTRNYGVAIILFSVAITCLMAPFTLMSFRSMKKMQELKPEIDRLMAKYRDDPKRANVEVFALYKSHRVSPLSGCLPMLLQMPIFIALFQAISHFIELRGKSFLWIRDLSLPDRMTTLPFSFPILGNELNALPIIMAAAMYFQSRISQRHLPSSEANPTSKLLSGPLMAIMFGVMFYHIPSGLVLYWLTNSLTSMAWYLLAR